MHSRKDMPSTPHDCTEKALSIAGVVKLINRVGLTWLVSHARLSSIKHYMQSISSSLVVISDVQLCMFNIMGVRFACAHTVTVTDTPNETGAGEG